MRIVTLALSFCLILSLSGCPKKKAENAEEPVSSEHVEGTSSGPSDANSDSGPDEMQKKEGSTTSPDAPAKSE